MSCGQRKNTDEVTIAGEVERRLRLKGFDVYVAIQQSTLKGLKENIFEQLASSEYFLFIDFKREQLDRSDCYRGSLFCHQELAVAAYLRMPTLGFQEKGVLTDDGILQFVQANCTNFTDRHTLASVVADKVEQERWRSDWRNQLVLERMSGQFVDAMRFPERKLARFFHLNVRNLNPHIHARNCYAFLDQVTELSSGKRLDPKCVEFKWAGYVLPNATILPNAFRQIDGVFVFHETPSTPHFNLFADSSLYIPDFKGVGEYDLQYQVISDNFDTISMTCRLHLDDNLNNVTLKQIVD